MSTAEIHTVDSAYMIEFRRIPGGGIRVKDLSGDTSPYTYTPPHTTYLYYYTDYGVWRRTTGNGKWEFSNDKEGRNYRPVIVRECGIPQEDKYGMACTPAEYAKAEVKRAVDWYKEACKKEVKSKMLQLIDVIFFNRKTKAVDYRKEIVAVDIEEAYMLAAQDYGKYNSKVHVRNAVYMFSFVEDDKE